MQKMIEKIFQIIESLIFGLSVFLSLLRIFNFNFIAGVFFCFLVFVASFVIIKNIKSIYIHVIVFIFFILIVFIIPTMIPWIAREFH